MHRKSTTGLALLVAGAAAAGAAACARAPAAAPPPVAPAPMTVPAGSPAIAPPPAAEVSAQVRSTRAGCSTEAARQGLEVIDFVSFNRLDDNNWDTTIRARRKGAVVRLGCRYDLRAGWTYMYEPPAADGGNPWGPGGAPQPRAATVPPTAAPGKTEGRATPPGPPRAEPKPLPGASIDLRAVSDSGVRSAILKTRDACLAEASRRRIAFEDFDAFRRVDAKTWETLLVLGKGRADTRRCQVDLGSGKATIR